MEKDRGARIIALVALVVAVIGVSVGFSLMTGVLTIEPEATYKPNPDLFQVRFSKNETSLVTGTVTGTKEGLGTSNFSVHEAAIAGDRKITGIGGTFTNPNQKFIYEFYALNNGQLNAYLKSVTFKNVAGKTTPIVCEANEGTTQSEVDAACKGITIKVIVDGQEYTESNAEISNKLLIPGHSHTVKVEVEYKAGSSVADGDFSVEFGDIVIGYSSAE